LKQTGDAIRAHLEPQRPAVLGLGR
jgi:hypothetical protein